MRHEQFGGEVVGFDFLFVAGGAAGGVAEVEPDQAFEDQVVAVVQGEVPEFVSDGETLPGFGIVAVDADHRGAACGPV